MEHEVSIEPRLDELERRVGELERRMIADAVPTNVPSKGLSIREFLLSKNPKTDVDRTLLIGYYVETIGKLGFFNLNDLRGAFAAAKEQLPTNLNDAVNKNIQKGFIMEVANRKEGFKTWVLTSSGERKVESIKVPGG
jgi:hypothetical protein